MEKEKINNVVSSKKKYPAIHNHIIVRILGYFLCFGVVLPASTLPVTWQHHLVIACVATFTLLNLFTRIQSDRINSRVHGLANIWLLNAICILGATSTGGIDSPFFFLLFVLIVVSSFSLEVPALVVQSVVLLGTFAYLGFNSENPDLAKILIQLLSLFSFTPLLMLLSSRFRREEKNSDKTTLLEQLLKTYEEEDQTLLDTITAGVCIVDHELRIEDLSLSAAQMIGISPAEAHGKLLADTFTIAHHDHPEIPVGQGILLSALYQRKTITDVHCQILSSFRPEFSARLHVAPILGEADHVVGLLIVFEDELCTKTFDERHPSHA
ncbi:hypothetical protein AUK40_02220 [Candidatus Wirthbacteria bacterium CG2_30_54_11]|uniref:PAS domain-containing protein n=1 Tax=Candidatus Wirthbacteria bacterium CG2_30_54_11 TaxID=1817892 RepID=A0A1J5ILE3_9BACT|nr:MAG: hypothetical protein AUK40_02220 [Candidatus Wirthbacteria bacterium CG2_30_54_11]